MGPGKEENWKEVLIEVWGVLRVSTQQLGEIGIGVSKGQRLKA